MNHTVSTFYLFGILFDKLQGKIPEHKAACLCFILKIVCQKPNVTSWQLSWNLGKQERSVRIFTIYYKILIILN